MAKVISILLPEFVATAIPSYPIKPGTEALSGLVFIGNVCARSVMQVGFAALEVGSVRAKNTKAVLLKNISDSTIG